jgi:hypothetical protein
MWDAEDLSQRVRRELLPEVARRLVDHHFGPIWRRDFLGLFSAPCFLFQRRAGRTNLLPL